MKKITKSLLTLALLMVGLTNVNAATTSIYKIDYSETKAYTFNAMGFSGIGYDAEKNALVITNDDDSGNPWDIQPMIAEGYAFDSSCDYKIVITMKANAAGSVPSGILIRYVTEVILSGLSVSVMESTRKLTACSSMSFFSCRTSYLLQRLMFVTLKPSDICFP